MMLTYFFSHDHSGGKLDELLKKVSQTGADPEPLKNAILNFRSSVDSMSARILSRGLPEELSKTIQRPTRS